MKTLLGLVTVGILAISLGVTYAAQPTALPSPQGQVIACSSDDMRRNYCSADVRGGVQLIKQRSDAACVLGRTWGFEEGRGIWVDRGCRADFQIGGSNGNNWGGWDNGYNIYCASDDGRRNVCPTTTRNGVQLVRKRSDASCDFGRSWGYDQRGIWVDRGCRADFQIGGGGSGGPGYGGPSGGGTSDGGSGYGGWQPGGNGLQVVSCSSDDMHRQKCKVKTRGGVRLVRQRSDADCIYGSTWGYDKHGIWVDRGCRADFEVGNVRY